MSSVFHANITPLWWQVYDCPNILSLINGLPFFRIASSHAFQYRHEEAILFFVEAYNKIIRAFVEGYLPSGAEIWVIFHAEYVGIFVHRFGEVDEKKPVVIHEWKNHG